MPQIASSKILVGFFSKQRARVDFLHRAGTRGGAIVDFIVHFVALEHDLLRIENNHEIARTSMDGVNCGLCLPRSMMSHARRQTPNGLAVGVNDIPVALDFAGFGVVGFRLNACHQFSLFLRISLAPDTIPAAAPGPDIWFCPVPAVSARIAWGVQAASPGLQERADDVSHHLIQKRVGLNFYFRAATTRKPPFL